MQFDSSFRSGLSVEFGWKSHLEQDILHDVAAESATDDDWFVFQYYVIKPPSGSGKCRRISHFAGHGPKRQLDRPLGCIPSSPAFAGPCIGGMPVRSQSAAIQPSQTDCVRDLIFSTAEN